MALDYIYVVVEHFDDYDVPREAFMEECRAEDYIDANSNVDDYVLDVNVRFSINEIVLRY